MEGKEFGGKEVVGYWRRSERAGNFVGGKPG